MSGTPALEVTQSVTAEPGVAGLVVRLNLARAAGAAATVRVTMPPGVEAAGHGGREEDGQVVWDASSLLGDGSITLRLQPVQADLGHGVFRRQELRTVVVASDGALLAEPPPLRLNGIWGEEGLRRTVLPTGLTIFTRERPESPTASVRMAIRAGSRDEDDITSGGSHWLEHAYFLGTPTRPSNQAIFNDIATVGGQTNASTGWEATDYWHLVPADDVDRALEVLSDQLLNSTFLPEAFDRERRVVFEELKRRNDTPNVRAFDEFINAIFRVSPLRRHPGGTIESVQSIPIETILAYNRRHYVTSNMVAAAAGRLRHDDMVVRIAASFHRLPLGPRHERPRVEEPPRAEREVRESGSGDRVAEVRVGWPAPGDDHPDSAAMYVLQDILGATGRRLSEEIRDRRALASHVSPSYFDFSDAGAVMLSATTQPANADQVISLLLDEVRRIRDGDVSDDDVQASLRAIAGRRAIGEETNQGQTQRAVIEVAGHLDSYEEYVGRLRAVTRDHVQKVAQRWLHPDHYTLVVVRA